MALASRKSRGREALTCGAASDTSIGIQAGIPVEWKHLRNRGSRKAAIIRQKAYALRKSCRSRNLQYTGQNLVAAQPLLEVAIETC